jgi:PAT family beta-lactamase induction signal transducer AmpG
MAFSNMGRAAGSGLVGTLKEVMSWEYVLLITALSPLITIFFIKLINFKKQRETIDAFSKIEL